MPQKPWPIIVLAAMQLMAPLTNLILNAALTGIPVQTYVRIAATGHDVAIHVILHVVMPLSNALLIFLCRTWSLAAFIAIEACLLAWNYHQRTLHPESFPFWAMSATNLVNVALVAYFLLPAVRRVYTNPKLRWWESKPRYLHKGPVELMVGATRHAGETLNVSEGGLFLKTDAALGVGERVSIAVDCGTGPIPLISHIVHAGAGDGLYGVAFEFENRRQQKAVRELIGELRRKGAPVRKPKVNWWLSFGEWLRAVRSDPTKALVPTLPDEVVER